MAKPVTLECHMCGRRQTVDYDPKCGRTQIGMADSVGMVISIEGIQCDDMERCEGAISDDA